MAMNVTNKTAIVTGAGSGINLSFAKLLLSKGCNVIFADLALRPEAKLVVDEYSAGNGGARAVFIQTDVVNWAQLGNLFDVAEKEFGNADIVVPGAGIFEPVGYFQLLPPQLRLCGFGGLKVYVKQIKVNDKVCHSPSQTFGNHQMHRTRHPEIVSRDRVTP